jgi:hypothetical protein
VVVVLAHPLRALRPALAAELVLVLAACGSNGPTPTPPPVSSAASSVAPAEASPPGAPSGVAATTSPVATGGSASPVPSPLGPGASIEPANFVAAIDNPWFPLKPGTVWTYRGVKDGEAGIDTMTATADTKVIAGVTCVVVHDQLVQGGKVKERTDDYYVQDVAGNVWYFGEATAELDDNGKVASTEGSWQTGVDGAMPGIIMPTDPEVGVGGPQEIYPGQAEDHFVVLLTNAKVKVPAGSYAGALITAEWTPLEPAVLSEKAYASGVGEVSEADVKGGDEKFELVSVATK